MGAVLSRNSRNQRGRSCQVFDSLLMPHSSSSEYIHHTGSAAKSFRPRPLGKGWPVDRAGADANIADGPHKRSRLQPRTLLRIGGKNKSGSSHLRTPQGSHNDRMVDMIV